MTLAALASGADLNAWMQRTIATATATLALDVASATVRGYTGQVITAVTSDVVTLPGSVEQQLLLPQRPVTAVTTVKVNDSAITDYTRIGSVLHRAIGWLVPTWLDWPWNPAQDVTKVEVTYSHGFAAVPADIKGVVLDLAAAIVTNPAQLSEEHIDDYSRRFAPGSVGGAAITGAHRRILDRLRVSADSVIIQ